jgi:ABC-2 type transport system permease protein
MILARLFLAIFVTSVQREVAFRANLLASIVQAASLAGASLLTILLVYRQTDALGGWTRGEAIVLLGTFQVMSGILATFIAPNVQWFGQKVQRGELDDVLLKPVPGLFLASVGTHAPLGLIQVGLGGATGIVGLRSAGAAPGVGDVLGFLALLAAGIGVTWATRVAVALVALWSPATSLDVVYDAGWQFARYPVSIFEQPFRFVFSWVVPLALVSSLPVRALTRGVSWPSLVAAVIVAVGAMAGVAWLWQRGLRRYTSATS